MIYEVFVREAGKAAVHGGSLAAATADAALAFAHEQFGRRGAWEEIWVVPRDQIAVMEAADVPGPAFDRSYRLVDGYRHVERRWREVDLARARQREGLRA
jgi:ring-1,2-phenylacetyl-CoA epoxidase subunit PaaB